MSMEERASGIILRTRPLTETSIIVQWITPEFGRMSTVAKGARRPKSTFAGKLDLYFEADFSFQRSRRGDLHTLREVSLTDTHGKLRQDLAWIEQAAYFTALVEQGTEPETPIAEIHGLFRAALEWLPCSAPQALFVHAFELKLLHLLGFDPDLDKARLTPAVKVLARALRDGEWSTVTVREAVGVLDRELNRFLYLAIAGALERVPHQRERAFRGTVL